MFDYFAITGATANWILAQEGRKLALSAALDSLSVSTSLASGVLAVGSLRIIGCNQTRVVAVWNKDLLGGAGYESWGVCRLTSGLGILQSENFLAEIFERFLAVSDLRLQGLKIDGAWVHRKIEEDFHICIAGRGSIARRFSLGFADQSIILSGGRANYLLAVGPLEGIIEEAPSSFPEEKRRAAAIVVKLSGLISNFQNRPVLDSGMMVGLREQFAPSSQILIDYGAGIPVAPVLRTNLACTTSLIYDDWIEPRGPLSVEQRAILEEDILLSSPVRIIGPGGSGKTLLLQLMAIRRVRAAHAEGAECRIGFVVHNAAMMQTVIERFNDLGAGAFLENRGAGPSIEVTTLTEYSRQAIRGEDAPVIDNDAYETKKCQRELVGSFLKEVLSSVEIGPEKYPLLHEIIQVDDAIEFISDMLVSEFGVAIKAHDLVNNQRGYVLSESPLSRFHALLSSDERTLVFDIFTKYQNCLINDLGVLDADDLAITVLGRITSPLWRLVRRTRGFDYIFVDEAQLFSENERRLFPLLTRGDRAYVPVALALDNAQNISVGFSAGLGLLGFGDLASSSLNSVFRSTPSILKLAFFVIQHSTDLFDVDFPDFTEISKSIIPDDHHFAKPPCLLRGGQARAPGRFVARIARRLRSANLRQICIVVFGERYWADVIRALKEGALQDNWIELTRRGDKVDARGPLIVVSKPEFVGGQEFDAVICVGLEEGVTPPDHGQNHALSSSLEQKALREMYVAFTRARYRLVIANSQGSNITRMLRGAVGQYIIEEQPNIWLGD